jgi:hypothetical protein
MNDLQICGVLLLWLIGGYIQFVVTHQPYDE